MYGVRYVSYQSKEKIPDPTATGDWGKGEALYLHVQVADTGRGMTDEELKPLFHKFSQASPKTHARELYHCGRVSTPC